MYSDQDRELMAEIVNKAIKGTEFTKIVKKLNKDDFNPTDTSKVIILNSTVTRSKDTLQKIFTHAAVNRKHDQGQFFHFKSVERTIEIIRKQEIQFTALQYQAENDHAEYSEFLKRSGFFKPFVDGSIEDNKRKIFVLCLTKNSREELFWNRYANKDTGVCIVFRFKPKNWGQGYYNFRDVAYDSGYRFEFLNDIRFGFMKNFGKELLMEGAAKFAHFYKRSAFSWESESRLSFDYKYHPKIINTFAIQESIDSAGNLIREYISLPLDNPFFQLIIEEIICGKKVKKAEITKIQTAFLPSNINLWKRA